MGELVAGTWWMLPIEKKIFRLVGLDIEGDAVMEDSDHQVAIFLKDLFYSLFVHLPYCKSFEYEIPESSGDDPEKTRAEVVKANVSERIHAMWSETTEWSLPGIDGQTTWYELRNAAIEVLFEIEEEVARQTLLAEQVVENCI